MPKGTQFRHDDHTRTKHRANVNGDVVSHCKHKRKKGDKRKEEVKRISKGLISVMGEHGKCCASEVFETAGKVDDYSNVMSDLVDQLALNNMNLTPRIV